MKNKQICTLSLLITILPGISLGCDNTELEGFSWGISQRQGENSALKTTTYTVEIDISQNEGFFGLYDGIWGPEAAKIAKKKLHKKIPKGFLTDKSISEAYISMDREMSRSLIANTSAVSAIFREKEYLHIAWVGDSRAVLVKRNGTIAEEGTTVDHKLTNPKEKNRICKAGAFTSWNSRSNKVMAGGIWPVLRTLGGGYFKFSPEYAPCGKGIIATPEVKSIQLNPDYELMILASRGVWNVLSNEEAAKIVKEELTKPLPCHPTAREKGNEADNNECALLAARALRDAAAKRAGSENNRMSVLVIQFIWPLEQ